LTAQADARSVCVLISVYRWRRYSWDTIVDRTNTWMDSSSHILPETTNCYTTRPMSPGFDSLHRTQRTLNSRVKLGPVCNIWEIPFHYIRRFICLVSMHIMGPFLHSAYGTVCRVVTRLKTSVGISLTGGQMSKCLKFLVNIYKAAATPMRWKLTDISRISVVVHVSDHLFDGKLQLNECQLSAYSVLRPIRIGGGGRFVNFYQILHTDWNLKQIFTQTWGAIDVNWG